MDLPNLLNKLKSNSEEPKKFIAVEIGFDAVKTAIWQSTGVHTEIVSVGSVQSWSSVETDDLITAIDTSLSDAQATVPEEPDQVIFGLPELWVDNDGIVENRKILLKTICKRLDLKAIGFVVTTEAMVHHLRDVEGGPPSAIILQIATSEIAVSLIYLGKLETTQVVGRSTNVASDVEEGLARIPHTGHLPSRIILLTNSDDPEPIKQELISYDWQKKLEFLHFPKVESLSKDWSIKSIAVAGGAEVIETLGFANVPQSTIKPPSEEIKESTPEVEPEPTLPPDLGFKPVNFSEPRIINDTNLEELKGEEVTNVETIEEKSEEITRKPPMNAPRNLLLGFGSRMKSLVIKPAKDLGSLKPRNPKKWAIPFLIIMIILALLGGAAFAYYRLPEAKIDVLVGLNPYQQQLSFTIDPTSTNGDMDNAIVAGKKIDIEKSGSKTIPTTGTKMVGERSKGKVTIYNRTTASKTLPAGTLLKNNKLQFTLDSSITIASASAETTPPFSINPATQEAVITASDIGELYNIPKDTQLSVANFSSDSFVAVVSNTLSGGSARKVAAVVQTDLDTVKAALIGELQTQINQSLTPNQDDGTRQISVGDPEVTAEKYSSIKGAEADDLTLELTVTQTAYQYDVAQLSLITQQLASKSLPPNVQLTPNSTEINTLSTVIKEDDKAEVSAQVVLQYLPRIETENYTKELVSVPLNQLEEKLKTIPNFQSYTITSKYLLLGRLPIVSDRIVMHIKPVPKAQ